MEQIILLTLHQDSEAIPSSVFCFFFFSGSPTVQDAATLEKIGTLVVFLIHSFDLKSIFRKKKVCLTGWEGINKRVTVACICGSLQMTQFLAAIIN